MVNMNKEITVCPCCGEPMIWTFAFSGCEYYCLMCGYGCGMFGGKAVEETKELKCKQKLYKKIFKVIYKDLIPAGAYYNKCKKCDGMKEHHRSHATKLELLKDKIARETLVKIYDKEGYKND